MLCVATRVGIDTPAPKLTELSTASRTRGTIQTETNPDSGVLRAPTGSASIGAPASAGFRARLNGATLSDLIQFECMERSRKIVRVSSGARCGFLYFRDGNLVHAVEGTTSGEAAFRVMLKWPSGVFEAWQGPWPQDESITVLWQNLLLRAAQAEDEENRKPKVVALRKEPGSMAVTPSAEPDTDSESPMTVHISSTGDAITGNAPPEFGEGIAYATVIADVLGELLGVERVHSIEYTLDHGACVVVRDVAGNLSAALGRGLDVASLKMLISSR